MIGSRVTRRYARALFDLAKEEQNLDQIESDLVNVRNILKDSDDFVNLLHSPVIQLREKREVFSELFKGKINRLTFDFFNLLLDKNRENLLSGIIDYFLKYLDESKGILRGDLSTAYPFSDAQKKSLKSQLDRITGKNVLLQEEIDATLIGGFVVRLDDTVIDISIKNQLDKMRERLLLTQ